MHGKTLASAHKTLRFPGKDTCTDRPAEIDSTRTARAWDFFLIPIVPGTDWTRTRARISGKKIQDAAPDTATTGQRNLSRPFLSDYVTFFE